MEGSTKLQPGASSSQNWAGDVSGLVPEGPNESSPGLQSWGWIDSNDPVPNGTIEVTPPNTRLQEEHLDLSSTTIRGLKVKHLIKLRGVSIVPDGTDLFFLPFPSTKVLGYFQWVPSGRVRRQHLFNLGQPRLKFPRVESWWTTAGARQQKTSA